MAGEQAPENPAPTGPAPQRQFASLVAAAKARAAEAPPPAVQEGAAPPAELEPRAAEPPAPATPATEEQPDPAMVKSWQDLSRRERDLIAERQRWTNEQRAMQAELEEARRLKKLAADNPAAAVRALGVSKGDLLDTWIGQDPDAPQSSGDLKQALELARQAQEKAAQLEQRVQNQEIEAQERATIRRLVMSSTDGEHEFVRGAMDRGDGRTCYTDVMNEAANIYAETKRVDYSAAIARVESRYEREAFALAEYLLQFPKLRDRMGTSIGKSDPGQPTPAAKPTPHAAPRTSSPTLTNDLNKQPAEPVKRELTIVEKRQEFNEAVRRMWKKANEQRG